MLKKILYLIFALAIGFAVYFISLVYGFQNRQIALLTESFLTEDYSGYLAFSTPYYGKVMEDITSDYHIKVYRIIGEEENKAFLGYVIFVSNLNEEKFTFAQSYDDENDHTNLTVEDDSGIVYDHIDTMKLENQEFVALSFGYTKYKGYYYLFRPEEAGNYTFRLYDYDNQEFSSFDISFAIEFDSEKSVEENREFFTASSDWTESDKVGGTKEVMKVVYRNMIIYGVLVIAFGLLVFRKSVFKKRTEAK